MVLSHTTCTPNCFRDGHCEPEEYMAELIGSVAFYILDAYGQAAS